MERGLLHKLIPFVQGSVVGLTLNPSFEKNKVLSKNDLPVLYSPQIERIDIYWEEDLRNFNAY